MFIRCVDMRPNLLNFRLFFIACFGWLLLTPILARAQATSYPPPSPPQWFANIPAPNLFPTPIQACRAQMVYFNPNAIFLGTGPVSPNYTGCRWDSSPPNANTVQPGGIWMTCATGSVLNNGTCTDRMEQKPHGTCQDTGPGAPPQPEKGNPVALNYCEKVERQTDYMSADGLFGITRQYHSQMREPYFRFAVTEIPGFGGHWHGVVPGVIVVQGSTLQYMPDNGDLVQFTEVAGATATAWTFNTSYSSNRLKLSMVAISAVGYDAYFAAPQVFNGPAEVRMDKANGEYILFRRAAPTSAPYRTLIPIEHGYANGYKINYTYLDANNLDTDSWPSMIQDSLGRTMKLTWQAAPEVGNTFLNGAPSVNVLTSALLPDGTKLNYTYGNATERTGTMRPDSLQSVQHVSATGTLLWARTFLYENTAFPYALTGQVDQNGNRLSTYSYDPSGRVASTEQAGGVNKYTIVNMEEGLGNGYGNQYRYVTNALGHQEDYTFFTDLNKFIADPALLQSVVGHASTHVPAATRTFTYSGYIGDRATSVVTDENGVQFAVNVDASLRPTLPTVANGTGYARQTQMTWHSTFDLPLSETLPGRTISYTYSPTGQPLTKTVTDTTTQTVPYTTAGQARTYTYSWTSAGRLASIHGPKPNDAAGHADLTSFTYDTSGNLLTSTNPIGQVTTLSSYDANGRPTLMTNPNGIVTAYVYDALGRVISVTVKHPTTASLNVVTSFSYDVEGRVTGITLPSTDTLTVDYNLAGQVLDVRAASGEKITYVNDALGDVTSETVTRTNATTARSITRTFDEIGRMLTETLGTGRTTSWAYDKLGQPTQILSARSNATQFAFDPLNRLVQTVAPDTGTTQLQYSVLDDVTAHTDPVSVQTSFVRNGFGEVIQEVSPDRGTSTYYYDAAGAMTASIDGRGQRVDYTRDILGRIIKKVPTGRPAAETITYAWDTAGISGSYGKGRLASIADGSGTTKFKYDHLGNLLIKQQTIGSTATASLTYAYDLANRVTQITYPSGRIVGYVRDTKGRVTTVQTKLSSSVTTWTVLTSGITYEAFGAMTGATYGNTLSFAQSWGNDGRLASRRLYKTTGGTNLSLLTYGYDNDDNITAITDGVNTAASSSFTYDVNGRMSQNILSSGSIQRSDFSYDLNGNRTSVVQRATPSDLLAANTISYTRTSGTNRFASVNDNGGTRSITYDARGNTATESRPLAVSVTTAYDGYGRLTSYTRTLSPTQANVYNGLDERVGITSGTDARRFVYDRAGRVLGEYGTSATDVRAETIWLTPDAANDNQPFGGGDGSSGYAPLAIAVQSGTTTALVWVYGNHLGVPLVTTNASGAAVTLSGFALPGFPGQIRTFDDLYYNQYRDYDPNLGRYIQADPIGLGGGTNPYVYANNNPMRVIDPSGRCGIFCGGAIGALVGGIIDLGRQTWESSHEGCDGSITITIDIPRLGKAVLGGAAFGAGGAFGGKLIGNAISSAIARLVGSDVGGAAAVAAAAGGGGATATDTGGAASGAAGSAVDAGGGAGGAATDLGGGAGASGDGASGALGGRGGTNSSLYDTSITNAGSQYLNVRTDVGAAEFQRNLMSNGYNIIKQTDGVTVLNNGTNTWTIYSRTSTGGAGAQFFGVDGSSVKYSLGGP